LDEKVSFNTSALKHWIMTESRWNRNLPSRSLPERDLRYFVIKIADENVARLVYPASIFESQRLKNVLWLEINIFS